jgi:hypothetical protein
MYGFLIMLSIGQLLPQVVFVKGTISPLSRGRNFPLMGTKLDSWIHEYFEDIPIPRNASGG